MGISDAAWGNSMYEYSFFITFLLLLQINESVTESKKKLLFWIVALIMIFNIIDNIVLSILFPQLNDYRNTIDEATLESLNAGDSTFYTMSVFFSAICFFLCLNTDNTLIKWFSLLCTLSGSVYVFGYCNKGSSIVFLALMLITIYVAKKVNPKRNIIVPLAGVCLFFYLVIFLFKEDVIDIIVALSPSERITTRLVTLIDPKNINADEVTVTGRTNLYFLSIETWLSNPIYFLVGIGDARDGTDAVSTGVGNHADFLDVLPRFGIIGAFLFFGAIYKMVRYVKALFDYRYKSQISILIVFFILSGLSKSVIVPEVACTLFLLLPLSLSYINK